MARVVVAAVDGKIGRRSGAPVEKEEEEEKKTSSFSSSTVSIP